ncbi:MAG: hypothetical protein ABIP85_01415, partial [Chthoniobacteraceae bacterium]
SAARLSEGERWLSAGKTSTAPNFFRRLPFSLGLNCDPRASDEFSEAVLRARQAAFCGPGEHSLRRMDYLTSDELGN